jgi:hypothetical protein
MTVKILLTITLLAAAKCSFSQDTTGGTRATFIIPLHRAKPKDVNTNNASARATDGTVTGLPEKINAPKAKKKKRKHLSTQEAVGNG